MKESGAKHKQCCGPNGCGKADSNTLVNSRRWCVGSACMAWEPEYSREDKDWAPSDETPEGWHRLNKNTIRRYYPLDSGDCGLKTKELQCNV